MDSERGEIMRKINRILAIVLALLFITPVAAHAKTTVLGGPYTGLKSTGQVIHLSLSGYPTNAGFYILECVQSSDSSRPTLCNQAVQLWISSSPGAQFAPTAPDIQFKPTASFTSGTTNVDCLKVTCQMFIRLDHTAPTDTSEDQFFPLTFVADSTSAANALPADLISAVVNGQTLSTSMPLNVKYRDVFKVEATAKSGLTLTYASLAPACAISGNEVTVLKGTGLCDIAITSAGNSQYAGITSHFPLKLVPGTQSVSITASAKSGTKITLPTESNFGEKVTYSVSKSVNCSLKGGVLTLNKKGACTVKASAPALADTYDALKQTSSIKIK